MKSIVVLAVLAVLATACTNNSEGGTLPSRLVQSELPITRVVLYRNGIGYIERSGTVKGSLLNLRIRHDQVKDILKSLTVVDRKGGYAVNITLPVEKSSMVKMSELPPQVRDSGGILAIIHAFRGAQARVETSGATYSGRIVGVENLGTFKKPNYRLTLLGKGRTLTVVSLSAITSLKVMDKTLTVGLEKALDVSLNKGTWKPINLTIHLSRGGNHDLTVSYVVEMPIWKPAYRLVIPEDGKNILLQGWSVVDNLSGDDWSNVFLSLTAGTPLAFKYDLYTPHRVGRPDLTPPENRMAEAPPTVHDATASVNEENTPKADESKPSSASRYYNRPSPKKAYRSYSRRRMSRGLGGMAERASRDKDSSYVYKNQVTYESMKRSYRNLVSGAQVGSLFRYDVAGRVTIPDRSSSLVSLINKDVQGADVLYYITENYDRVPYRAVKYKNTSGFVLERGPVAIYRSGQFVGEAIGGVVEKNATAFVPYAREGKVIVNLTTKYENEGERLISIYQGRVNFEERQVNKFVYTVENRSGKEFTMYVRRNIRTNWKPHNAKTFIFEKSVYYVPVKVTTGKSSFTIKETTPVRRVYGLYYYKARNMLKLLIKSTDLPDHLKKSITEVLAIYDSVAQLRSSMDTLDGSRR
ncbi:DUF4139 domain-containing protein, partial [Myxococcota bacterium]|nr:DUF4139 domain-containing protein [Myxococcota bacterium]